MSLLNTSKKTSFERVKASIMINKLFTLEVLTGSQTSSLFVIGSNEIFTKVLRVRVSVSLNVVVGRRVWNLFFNICFWCRKYFCRCISGILIFNLARHWLLADVRLLWLSLNGPVFLRGILEPELFLIWSLEAVNNRIRVVNTIKVKIKYGKFLLLTPFSFDLSYYGVITHHATKAPVWL